LRWAELTKTCISPFYDKFNYSPIEQVIETLAGLIKEGKFDYIGLSEVSAATIRRAAKIHPITTVEVEFSLFSTEIKTNGVLEACIENGIKIVAYSPLGRGILSGKWEKPEDVPEALKKSFPRYSDENFQENKKFVELVKQIGAKKGATPAQVALKWILTQGNGNIIPIPGATRADRVNENTGAADLVLTQDELAAIDHFVETTDVKGGRYAEAFVSGLWG
jgi:pyridoxine 4-dehydrogenase